MKGTARRDGLDLQRGSEMVSRMAEMRKMTEEERATLWKQYAQTHAKIQETFDASIRTLAAAGLAATVSIVTALKTISGSGKGAAIAFLVSLGANLVSYATAQVDMRSRLAQVRVGSWKGADMSVWTEATFGLNVLSCIALLAGGGLLAYFVTTAV
jgi:hypothetical protein